MDDLLLCHAVIVNHNCSRLPTHTDVPVLSTFDVVEKKTEKGIYED